MILWFHDLPMPVNDAEPVALYLYKYGCLYIQNICFSASFFNLIFKLCHVAEWLRKTAKIQLLLFAPHSFVTGVTGDFCYGNAAFRL